MQTLHIAELVIHSDRQRQSFDDAALEDLATSIDETGIIHPPAVRNVEGQPMLVAGERRVRAMASLIEMGKRIRHGDFLAPEGHIPFLDLGKLDDVRAFEAELAENIFREDLNWQERAKAEARLHAFRTEQKQKVGETQTLTATATEIIQRQNPEAGPAVGSAITQVATRINLAKFLDDPDVAKAKSEKDAVKIIRQKQQARENAIAAQAFDESAKDACPHRLLVGDSTVHLERLPDATFDVILTDPPYGIDADTFGDQSGTGHEYDDSEQYFDRLIASLSEETYRIAKAQAHAYVFCDPRRFGALALQFELAGWEVWPIPLIWAKGNGMLPRPDHAPRRTYEAIMFAIKGNKPVKCVRGDVISVPGVRNLKHGAQKPVDLYVDLLGRSAAPGDSVIDPFAGSGTIFPAANRAKLIATGIELSEQYANICKLRMMETEDDDGIPEIE